MYVCMRVCVFVCMRVCVLICMFVCVFICMYVGWRTMAPDRESEVGVRGVRVYICVYVCACACACVQWVRFEGACDLGGGARPAL